MWFRLYFLDIAEPPSRQMRNSSEESETAECEIADDGIEGKMGRCRLVS